MKVNLAKELKTHTKKKAFDNYEPPALEEALLEGLRSPHRTYGKATLQRIRKAGRFRVTYHKSGLY